MKWILPAYFAFLAAVAHAAPVGEEMSASTVRSLVGKSGMGIRKYYPSVPNGYLESRTHARASRSG